MDNYGIIRAAISIRLGAAMNPNMQRDPALVLPNLTLDAIAPPYLGYSYFQDIPKSCKNRAYVRQLREL